MRKYHPDLTPSLAPIVSPMIAMARVLHDPSMHGPDAKVVFVGPCIAKKGEAASADILFEIDAVLTFDELRQMFAERGITPAGARRRATTRFDGRRTARSARCSRSPAACCRRPSCPKT